MFFFREDLLKLFFFVIIYKIKTFEINRWNHIFLYDGT